MEDEAEDDAPEPIPELLVPPEDTPLAVPVDDEDDSDEGLATEQDDGDVIDEEDEEEADEELWLVV